MEHSGELIQLGVCQGRLPYMSVIELICIIQVVEDVPKKGGNKLEIFREF